MSVPKKRMSRSRTRTRRAHDFLAATFVSVCACGAPVRRHRMCPACGQYRGKQLVEAKSAD